MASFTAYTKCNTPNRLYTPVLWKTVDIDLSKGDMAAALATGTHGVMDIADNEAVLGGYLFVSTAFTSDGSATVQFKVGSTALTGSIAVATLADETLIPVGYGLTTLTDNSGGTASSVLSAATTTGGSIISLTEVNNNFASLAANIAQLTAASTGKDKLRERIRFETQDDGTYWTDEELDVYIAEAQRDFCERTQCLRTESTISSSRDGLVYNLPEDCIELSRVTDEDDVALNIVHADELEQTLGGNPSDFSESGDPTHAVLGLDDVDQFRLYPRPTTNAVSDGIEFAGSWTTLANFDGFYDLPRYNDIVADDRYLFVAYRPAEETDSIVRPIRRADWTAIPDTDESLEYLLRTYGGEIYAIPRSTTDHSIYRLQSVPVDGDIFSAVNKIGDLVSGTYTVSDYCFGGGYLYYSTSDSGGRFYRADSFSDTSPQILSLDSANANPSLLAYDALSNKLAIIDGYSQLYVGDYDDTNFVLTEDLNVAAYDYLFVERMWFDQSGNLFLSGYNRR